MSIAFDAITNNKNNSASAQSFSHTVPSNGSLVVCAGNRDQGAPSAVTYDGDSFDESYVSGQQGIYVWRAPATGSNTVAITYGGSGVVSAHALTFIGHHNDDMLLATNIDSSSGTDIQSDVTTTKNLSIVLSFVVTSDGLSSVTPDSGQTIRGSNSPSTNHETFVSTIVKASAGSQQMDYTLGNSEDYNALTVELATGYSFFTPVTELTITAVVPTLGAAANVRPNVIDITVGVQTPTVTIPDDLWTNKSKTATTWTNKPKT